MSSQRLARLASRAARDEAALAQRAETVFARLARFEPGGLVLDGARLRDEPEAIGLRVLERALDAVASGASAAAPKRLERLETLAFEAVLPALAQGRAMRRTLRGVLIATDRHGNLAVSEAPPRKGGSVAR